ncbi:hypothetical protein TSAR_002725 [Trichomalopsis sarcophagae]|uniref:Uncharacterized protein n=1 Tax=Trichomalopsis sarcophagae TaxID=543379 RepID=A0A232F893_9HYME|nr:hypothetical protein TSAR_002725 [Trichomalopsis sarcophagae]
MSHMREQSTGQLWLCGTCSIFKTLPLRTPRTTIAVLL